MGVEGVVFFIIMLFVFFGRVLPKLLEQAGKQQARPPRPPGGRADFRATPDEVLDFLRGLEAKRPPQPEPKVAAELPVPEEGPVAPGLVSMGLPLAADRMRESEEPVAVAPTRRKRRRPTRRRAAVPPAPLREAPTQAPEAAALKFTMLRGAGLKQAVIWSEILGPPVSMRRGRVHRHPAREQ